MKAIKTISPAQHLAITFSSRQPGNTPVWAREGETQDKALKRHAAELKREINKKGSRKFPRFMPGVTTVREYVEEYYALNFGREDYLTLNRVGPYDRSKLSENPQNLFDDSVIFEELQQDPAPLDIPSFLG